MFISLWPKYGRQAFSTLSLSTSLKWPPDWNWASVAGLPLTLELPPASIGWVALSSVVRSFVRPSRIVTSPSPLFDVLDHTNHIFSVRIWSWQHVSVIHRWVEPSLLLSSLAYLWPCCLEFPYIFSGAPSSDRHSTIASKWWYLYQGGQAVWPILRDWDWRGGGRHLWSQDHLRTILVGQESIFIPAHSQILWSMLHFLNYYLQLHKCAGL